MSVILATWEAESRRISNQGQPRQKRKFMRTHLNGLKKKAGTVAHACHPDMMGSLK
jgi:hypothetical protein